jgi:dihydroxyacetone kinase DhaKLM complex PTS-EIIA-like component DhaM
VTRIELEPGKIEQGLLKLTLAVVELLRQVLEKQAMRRVESGGLADDEIDRLGLSFMQIESAIQSLQARFGIDDLNMDLGPLGRLLDE